MSDSTHPPVHNVWSGCPPQITYDHPPLDVPERVPVSRGNIQRVRVRTLNVGRSPSPGRGPYGRDVVEVGFEGP